MGTTESTKFDGKTKLEETGQIRTWSGNFGREYTDRNGLTATQLDELYSRNYGVSRTEMNERFLGEVPKDARILEIGCNMGNQLLLLRQMGFANLHGVEIQPYALDRAKERLPDVVLSQASAFDIPYPDSSFDLVFTSGVLIHIAPSDLSQAMAEIHRCTRNWIWGFEYYAPEFTEILYRGHSSLLWKADYARFYMQEFSDLELIREDRFPYLDNNNVDTAFLLRRGEVRLHA